MLLSLLINSVIFLNQFFGLFISPFIFIIIKIDEMKWNGMKRNELDEWMSELDEPMNEWNDEGMG